LVKLSHIDSPLPNRRFPIVLADPPYRYDRRWAVSRQIENHYPTMTTEAICALPVVNLATADAMLFLWAPAPLLTDALRMMTAWGFEYATCATWVKDRIGMGVYVRQQHELLLIGKRGLGIVPDPSTLSSSVITAPRREHSRKPDEAYGLIERMYPELAKIELFARSSRPGWGSWGNEVTAASTARHNEDLKWEYPPPQAVARCPRVVRPSRYQPALKSRLTVP
jgi:N6-adenosine-specific RNA methylase IME4